MKSDEHEQFWRELEIAEQSARTLRVNILKLYDGDYAILKERLRGPSTCGTVLEIIDVLPADQIMPFLTDLLAIAIYQTGHTEKARRLILTLPRKELLNDIERASKVLIENEDEIDYAGLLRLYEELDLGLAVRLAKCGLTSSNPEIKELGQEFLTEYSEK